jgi:hypothetical protein
MCFFDQTAWPCGSWRWGRFREQCYKEKRTGEVCGLRLIHSTHWETDICSLCQSISAKERRIAKMKADLARWYRQDNRQATIAKTESEIAELYRSVHEMTEQHSNNAFGNHRHHRKQGVAPQYLPTVPISSVRQTNPQFSVITERIYLQLPPCSSPLAV